jgi:hypothetical protein
MSIAQRGHDLAGKAHLLLRTATNYASRHIAQAVRIAHYCAVAPGMTKA